jgi:hypothetical protein
MTNSNFTIGQIIKYLPANNTLVRETKILKINEDGSLKTLEVEESAIALWEAGFDVSTTVYVHQIRE